MSETNYILNSQLPTSMNFDLLKEEALAFIQSRSGNNWTNLNPSDPGITILDQVCYALTELGYCSSFPMRDLLTGENGDLPLKNRFFLPSEILTTTPVTIADYRKVVIDASPYIENALVMTKYPKQSFIAKRVQVFLKIASSAPKANYIRQAYSALQAHRNLANLIDVPKPFKQLKIKLKGKVVIEDKSDLNQIVDDLNMACDQAVFPSVYPISFKEAFNRTNDFDEVMDGPLLKNGFILTDDLGDKKDEFTTMEIAQIINKIENVVGVTELKFKGEHKDKTKIKAKSYELLVFDWEGSVQSGDLVFSAKGNDIQANLLKPEPVSTYPTLDAPVGKTDEEDTIPKGKFRDVNSYYSIQNTFPESYGVGLQGAGHIALKPEVKQLKGYLSLFDQVLANQFSQLANVGALFSFENALSGDPSDREAYYAKKNRLESMRSQSEYPIPYESFSPTYFYQSLYDVPNIKPLLKDNHVFDFSSQILSPAELESRSWKNYKSDPYNAYIKGLMNLMVKKEVNMERRNNILDHLLARHGESALVIDQMIKGSQYSGDPDQDKVIFKSLYLQNLGLLSYHQPKGYDCASANRLEEQPKDIKINGDRLEALSYTRDFVFDCPTVDRREKLEEADFTNFSALELKLSLLFGLKPIYADFIIGNYEEEPDLTKLALWLVNVRKGILMVETCLLHQSYMAEVGAKQMRSETFEIEEQLIFVLPDFISVFNTVDFQLRLDYFLKSALPVEVDSKVCFVSQTELEKLIPLYTAWFNSIIQKKSLKTIKPHYNAAEKFKNQLENVVKKHE